MMYLYELALELGERSTELAERARQHGIAGASPTTMLTPAQVVVLRGNGPSAPPPADWGQQMGAPGASLPTPPGIAAHQRTSAPRSGLSGGHYALFGVLGVGVLALFGFMFLGTAEESYRPLGDGATTEMGSDMVPADVDRFCTAADQLEQSADTSVFEGKSAQEIQDTLAATYDTQMVLMSELVESGPLEFREDMEFAREELSHMLDGWDRNASPEENYGFVVPETSERADEIDRVMTGVIENNCG